MCKILVVDDEETVRSAIQRRLSRDGLKVELASGESEATAMLKSSDPPYDVVLTDESMKHGAFDYVQKNTPGVDVYDAMSDKVAQAMERRRSSLGTIRRMDWFARLLGK